MPVVLVYFLKKPQKPKMQGENERVGRGKEDEEDKRKKVNYEEFVLATDQKMPEHLLGWYAEFQ